MSSIFQIKQGDTLPKVSAALLQSGTPIDLTGCTVRLRLYSEDGVVVLNQACTIVSPTAGTVEYQWLAGETSEATRLSGEFVVTYSNQDVLTVPTVGTFVVVVNARTP